jgi:hypothetical protein
MRVRIEVSPGELLDRLTIMRIKAAHAVEESARRKLHEELVRLEKAAKRKLGQNEDLAILEASLGEINRQLWEVENGVRSCERENAFGKQFIAWARLVYTLNDQRSDIKTRIDTIFNSESCEMKIYEN